MLVTCQRFGDFTLGGIASICFKFHFQTDYQQTLRIQIQGSQGCQKIRKIVRNLKLPIARSTIHPSLSKIKNHYWKTSKIEKKNHLSIMGEFFPPKNVFFNLKIEFFHHFFFWILIQFLMVFNFTQFWLDGRPGNEYFWISHKISGLLTPLTPLGVRPQWFETDLSRSSYSAMAKWTM